MRITLTFLYWFLEALFSKGYLQLIQDQEQKGFLRRVYCVPLMEPLRLGSPKSMSFQKSFFDKKSNERLLKG